MKSPARRSPWPRAIEALAALFLTTLVAEERLLAAVLDQPTGLWVDQVGTLLIADRSHNRIQSVDRWGAVVCIAGDGVSGFAGDGGPATLAQLRRPNTVAGDNAGNLYVVDTSNNRIRRIDASGIITTVAGSFLSGYGGDNGPATQARLYLPRGASVDSQGNLYIADTANHRLRRVSPGGVITTVAGTGTPAFGGDGGPAAEARLNTPVGVLVDAQGNVYVADTGNHRVRRIDASGTITTVAGSGVAGYAGDNGSALSAQLDSPQQVCLDQAGALYVADTGNHRVRRVGLDGIISTVAGTGVAGLSGDGGPANAARLNTPTAIWLDGSGGLLIADSENDRIRRVTAEGTITTAVGNNAPILKLNAGLAVDEGATAVIGSSALRAIDPDTPADRLLFVVGAVPVNGNLTISGRSLLTGDTFSQADLDAGLLSYSHNDSQTAIDAFTFTVTDGTVWLPGATFAITVQPVQDGDEFDLEAGTGIALRQGDLFYVERLRNRVQRVDVQTTLTIVAGTGVPGSLGDGGPATQAELRRPYDVYADPAGDLYLADTKNHHIRRVAADGTISTFAGSFLQGFAGDGGPALEARFSEPRGICGDGAGTLYIADTGNHRIRRVAPDGTVTTVAGNGISGFTGDGGPGVQACLNAPVDVQLDQAGNLYIADTGNHRVRRLGADGVLMTVAGDGVAAFGGDGGLAVAAHLRNPIGVYAAEDGSVYIADAGNRRVRRMLPDGTITTCAGNGVDNREGDGGPALEAGIQSPLGVHGGEDGNLYLVDTEQHRIRWVDTAQVIHTLVPNYAPVLAVNTGLSLEEGAAAVIDANKLRGEDADDPTSALVFTLGTAPVAGRLERDGQPLGQGGTFTQADLDAGRVSYLHDGGETTEDSFTFSLGDGTLVLPGATFAIAVIPRNDAPFAHTGEDQQLLAPGRFIYAGLDASGTRDADSPMLMLTWEVDGRMVARGDRAHAEMPAVVMEVGTHLVRLTVEDGEAAPVTDEVTVIVNTDQRAPVVHLTSPADGTVVRGGEVTLTGYIEEEIVLNTLKVNGRARPFIGHAPRYDFSFSVAVPEQGANPIAIEAADISGNQSTATLIVQRDSQPPVLTIAEPAAGTVVAADQPVAVVRGMVDDPGSGVAAVTVNGTPAALTGNAFEAQVDLGGEGRRVLRVRATDTLGNLAQADVEVMVDTRAPVLTVLSPVHRSVVEHSPVEVQATATDAGSGVASVTVNGTAATLVNDRYSLSVPLPDGLDTLVVVATDGAGRQTSRTVQVEIRTAPPATPTVSMVLRDSQGRPVAGKRVDLLREDGRASGQRLNTGEEGRALFQIDPTRRYLLKIYHAGATSTTTSLGPGEELTVDLVASSLTLTTSSGAPIAGMRVDLLKEDGTATDQRLTTDTAGQATFEVLAEAVHRFRVVYGGGTLTTEPVVGDADLVVSTQATGVDLAASDGQPIPGARIDLLKEDGTVTDQRLTTDAAGQARFEALSGFAHRFRVVLAGGTHVTDVVTGGAVVPVNTVAGGLLLLTSSEVPLPGVRVDLLKEDGTATGLRTTTGIDGTARFEVLPAFVRRFRVVLNSGSYISATVQGPGDLTVRTVQSQLSLTDHRGQPLAGTRVDLLRENGAGAGERATTDAAGLAGFELLPGDTHALRVYLNGGTYTVGPLADAQDAAVATHWSQLALRDAVGNPLAGARVDLLGPDGTATGCRTTTDAQGLAGFEVLPDHHVRFRITYAGASHVTDLVPAGNLSVLTLDVAGNSLVLELLSSQGNALSGVRVDLLKEDGRGTGQQSITNPQGCAQFTVLPGARHRLKVTLNGGIYTTETLLAGSRATVRTGSSGVQLLDSQGAPLAGTRVDLLKADATGTGQRTQTDDAGMAAFEILPGVVHLLRVTYAGGYCQTASLAFDEDAVVQTQRSAATVLRAGTPVSGARVDLLKENGDATGLRLNTDPLGVAGFEVLPGQVHLLRARVSGSYYSTAPLSGGEDAVLEISGAVAKAAVIDETPAEFALLPGYPNPFNPSTTLRYVLAAAGPVRLAVYSAAGQRVRVLVDAEAAPGSHAVVWDGRDDAGRLVASGTYLYRLEAGGNQAVGRITFAR